MAQNVLSEIYRIRLVSGRSGPGETASRVLRATGMSVVVANKGITGGQPRDNSRSQYAFLINGAAYY